MQKDCLEGLVGRELVRQELQARAGGCRNLRHPWVAGGCQNVPPAAAVHQDCLSSSGGRAGQRRTDMREKGLHRPCQTAPLSTTTTGGGSSHTLETAAKSSKEGNDPPSSSSSMLPDPSRRHPLEPSARTWRAARKTCVQLMAGCSSPARCIRATRRDREKPEKPPGCSSHPRCLAQTCTHSQRDTIYRHEECVWNRCRSHRVSEGCVLCAMRHLEENDGIARSRDVRKGGVQRFRAPQQRQVRQDPRVVDWRRHGCPGAAEVVAAGRQLPQRKGGRFERREEPARMR